jgi:hypothetical protein
MANGSVGDGARTAMIHPGEHLACRALVQGVRRAVTHPSCPAPRLQHGGVEPLRPPAIGHRRAPFAGTRPEAMSMRSQRGTFWTTLRPLGAGTKRRRLLYQSSVAVVRGGGRHEGDVIHLDETTCRCAGMRSGRRADGDRMRPGGVSRSEREGEISEAFALGSLECRGQPDQALRRVEAESLRPEPLCKASKVRRRLHGILGGQLLVLQVVTFLASSCESARPPTGTTRSTSERRGRDWARPSERLSPDAERVYHLTADGEFMMNLADFHTAVNNALPPNDRWLRSRLIPHRHRPEPILPR